MNSYLTPSTMGIITSAAIIAAPVFAKQEWEWKRDAGPLIPGVTDIVETLRTLVQHITDVEPGFVSTSTGRFTVRVDPENNEGQIYLNLGYFDLLERDET